MVVSAAETAVVGIPVVVSAAETAVVGIPVVVSAAETAVVGIPVALSAAETAVVGIPVMVSAAETAVVEIPVACFPAVKFLELFADLHFLLKSEHPESNCNGLHIRLSYKFSFHLFRKNLFE